MAAGAAAAAATVVVVVAALAEGEPEVVSAAGAVAAAAAAVAVGARVAVWFVAINAEIPATPTRLTTPVTMRARCAGWCLRRRNRGGSGRPRLAYPEDLAYSEGDAMY